MGGGAGPAVTAYPSKRFQSVFDQLQTIVYGDLPQLPSPRFSEDAVAFCAAWYVRRSAPAPPAGPSMLTDALLHVASALSAPWSRPSSANPTQS